MTDQLLPIVDNIDMNIEEETIDMALQKYLLEYFSKRAKLMEKNNEPISDHNLNFFLSEN